MTTVLGPGAGHPTRRRALAAPLAGLLAAALAGMLSACASAPTTKTTKLKFTVQADDLINPNVSGEASPVVVRLYELKANSAFEQASFFDLLDNDATKLGTDLVAKREIELKPNDDLSFERDSPIETRYLGIIAGFRTLDTAKWRTVIEIEPEVTTALRIKLTAQTINVDVAKERKGFF